MDGTDLHRNEKSQRTHPIQKVRFPQIEQHGDSGKYGHVIQSRNVGSQGQASSLAPGDGIERT